MAVQISILFAIFAVGVAYSVRVKMLQASIAKRLPPGPKPLPLLGNIKDFPGDGEVEFQHWLKHKDLYGPISSVTVMGMTLIIIHDKQMAHELLSQASSKTSGRPEMVMANKLCGYDSIVVCQGYTPRFRRYRKLLHKELGQPASAESFRDTQELEVKKRLLRTFREPGNLLQHYKTAAGAMVLKMAYGYTAETESKDRLTEISERMVADFSLAAVPMSWAPDIIPALQYLPNGFPGATFQNAALRFRRTVEAAAYIPFQFVQRQMATMAHRPSYVSRLIQELSVEGKSGSLTAEDESDIMWSAASLYGAAADTSVITLTVFTLAMIRFPEVQRKAQEEIDQVVGKDRLPTFDDRKNLPYVQGVVKEALRWWPLAPMGFPHTATEEIEFRGYTIPKGAMMLPAVCWFMKDPEVYSEPETFDPSRYLAPRSEPDPALVAFGFGRRRCPGQAFAEDSLFVNIAQNLAVFNIAKAVDKEGKEISVDDVKPKPGILTYLSEFQFKVDVRGDQETALLRELDKQNVVEQSDGHLLEGADEFDFGESRPNAAGFM